MSKRRKRFLRVYRRLSVQGWCDGAGGRESERVYGEWVQAGCPAGLAAFIRWRANLDSSGEYLPGLQTARLFVMQAG